MKFQVLAVLLCVGWVSAGYPGCPGNFTYSTTYSSRKTEGLYYVQASTSDYQKTGCPEGCVTILLTTVSDTKFNANFCCPKEDGSIMCNERVGSGQVEFVDPVSQPGVLTYYTGGKSYINFVLNDDVESHIVVYICGAFEDGTPYKRIFVFTRERNPPPEIEEKVNAVLDRSGVDRSDLKPVSHGSRCKYLIN